MGETMPIAVESILPKKSLPRKVTLAEFDRHLQKYIHMYMNQGPFYLMSRGNPVCKITVENEAHK